MYQIHRVFQTEIKLELELDMQFVGKLSFKVGREGGGKYGIGEVGRPGNVSI